LRLPLISFEGYKSTAAFTFAIVSPNLGLVTETNGAPGKIVYLGACLIAAVRLAREEKWDNPRRFSPCCRGIMLAWRIYDPMKGEFPRSF
jgi:hypothetical protein